MELSIVLVILGLLTGGILAGQSLIRAAELRSVVSGLERYSAAIYTFRDKYMALPGDMPNATRFWGAQTGAPGNCFTASGASPATCDGNGDGRVLYYGSNGNEVFRAWQHLANAGLVEGTYTGLKKAGATDERETDAGINCPAAKLDNAAYFLRYFLPVATDTNWFQTGNYGSNLILVGLPVSGVENWGAFLKPEEAWSIDSKLDDGTPAYGKIRTTTPNWTYTANCATDASATATYNLTYPSKACSLMFLLF